MNRRSQRQMKLLDSLIHGADAELFIVEGESAASSVFALCNRQYQAVLPLQGKPLNAYRATASKVNASPLHVQFANALGLDKPTAISEEELAKLNFGKVFLLFDPDADGIHIGALVLMYLQKWLPQLIAQQRVFMLRSPMFAVMSKNPSTNEQFTEFAYLPEQLAQIKQGIAHDGNLVLKTERYQSVGSVPPTLLERLCINPNTRQANAVTPQHVEAVLSMFG